MEAPKFYCPYCSLELAENGRHLCDTEAWELFNCEYNTSEDSTPPVSELEIKQKELKRVTDKRKVLKKIARKLNDRISELASYT